MRYKKLKTLVIGISLIMNLSACGNANGPAEVVATSSEIEVETQTEESAVIEESERKEEPKEAETEQIEEVELPAVPYFEENELEFCNNLSVETQAVVTNINDETDMKVMPATWTLKNISIEDGEEDTQIITITSSCTSYYWTDRKNRQMYSIMLPAAQYCDLNTGECYPSAVEIGDIELGYETTVNWDNIVYKLDCTGKTEWEDDKGGWTSDGEGGYVHETTVRYTDNIVVTPKGYDSMGIIVSPFTIKWMEDLTIGVSENRALIKEVLETEEGSYLFSVMDVYEMLNNDAEEDAAVSDDKSGATTNNETSKDNTSSNSSSSKDNTTPKQEQPAHTHSYTSSVAKNPTCTEAGVKTYTCSCGNSYTEAIPANGHSWSTTTETISHPSTGHYETVTKKEIWCGCGFTCTSQAELNAHQETCDSTCGVREWSENVWQIDSEAWDEVITVTKCSVCGAQG